MSIFSERLKLLRKKHKITQEELAIRIGVERSSIGKYESTDTIPSPNILTALAEFFSVTTDYLLGVTNKPDRIAAPPELAEYGVEWVSVVKKARASGLTPDDIEKIIEVVSKRK